MPISFVKYVIDALFSFLEFAIIAAVVLSWLVQFDVVNYRNPLVRQIGNFLDAITRPLFAPVRKVVPTFGGVDLSPIIVFVIIITLQYTIGWISARYGI